MFSGNKCVWHQCKVVEAVWLHGTVQQAPTHIACCDTLCADTCAGECGSCWAFASASMAEAGHFINTNEIINLSEKQLVDCDASNSACNGG